MTTKNSVPNTIRLTNGDMVAEFHPRIGAALSRLAWRELDIMRPTSAAAITDCNVRQMACYPLVPYSNRIGHGELCFGKEVWRLRNNFPNEPHSIHGLGWQREWVVDSYSANSLTLSLRHIPDVDWPFAFDVVQDCRLTNNELLLRLSATNTGEKPMPVGLGFHPFFRLSPETTLQTEWSGYWVSGVDKLPREWIKSIGSDDFRSPRLVSDWQVDRCFTGWNQRAMLGYSDYQLVIESDGEATKLVCFAPNDGRNFIALEPVTNVNDAFALAAHGVADTGMRVLDCNERFSVAMTIRVTRPSAGVQT